MKRDGSSQRKIIFSSNEPQNPAYPCFSSIQETIYYISGTPFRVWKASVSDNQASPVTTNIIADVISVSRTPVNTIEAERFLSIEERDPYISLTYYLLMHVDRIPLPSSVILTEVIPLGWELTDVRINGAIPVQMTSNNATTGELKWIFGQAGIAALQDSVIQITIECLNPAGENYGEYRSFSGWCQISDAKTFTRGQSSFLISDPFIPADLDRNWHISDEELLYAIYLWSINGKISMWPENLSEWDFLLLSLISYWANEQGYIYDVLNSRTQGKYLWKKA